MNDIRNKYIETFFSTLTDEDKKNIYFDSYLWHTFSYGEITCLEGKEAIMAFNKINKNKVYIFFQKGEEIYEKEDINYDKLLNMIFYEDGFDFDCYIVDKDFKWTFVFTHETMTDKEYTVHDCYYIGPFFTTIDMIKKDII